MIQWAIRSAVALCLLAPCLVASSWADDENGKADASSAVDADSPESVESDDKKGDAVHLKAEKDHDTKDGTKDEGAGNEVHESEGAGKAHAEDGHDKHAGEDPHDLGHSNALPSQDKVEEWKFDLAIYSFVVFLLLLAILMKFAWGPIMEALGNREQRIASLIDEAEQSAVRAKEQLAAYEAKLAESHKEADEIVSRAKDSAQQQADSILEDAKTASQRERDRAVADIELAKNEALGEITQRSVDIALGLAKSVVGREIKADDHDSLIKEALAKFPS